MKRVNSITLLLAPSMAPINTYTLKAKILNYNAPAKAYSLQVENGKQVTDSIHQNYLTDPNGKTIAKNLRSDELNKELSTLFN